MTQQAPQEPAKRSMPYLLRVALTIGAVVAALVIATKMGITGNNPTPSAQPAARSAPAATSVAPAPAAVGTVADGVWIVGTDVQPGTYRSAGASGDRYCMWSRHSSVSGGPLDNIIASDGSYTGQTVVTIAASDKLFRTKGCAAFQKV